MAEVKEFRPYGLFYDVLSGEFTPPTDPLNRSHTLARLAVAACEKGEWLESEEGRVYYPSWANNSYISVTQPPDRQPFDSQVTLRQAYGRWPRELFFTDHTRNGAMGQRGHELVITGRNLEIVHPLELGAALQAARREVTGIAQDFYDDLKPNS